MHLKFRQWILYQLYAEGITFISHLFSAANLVKFSQKVILTCKKIPICPFLTAKTSKLDIIFRGYHSTFIHAWRRRARETAWMTLK